MADDTGDEQPQETWYGRIRRALRGEPATRDDLLEFIREPHWKTVLDPDEQAMLEGVLEVSQTQVRDVMVPRSQMVVLESDWPREQILRTIVDSGHSRFPVMGESHEEVAGILLAKDLLRFFVESPDQPFDLKRWLRPATFIPETKRLNTLLKEIRLSRNHIAIVVDEYGGIAGLLTIEDVLEEIVGEIDDEYDAQEAAKIQKLDGERWLVRALTRVEEFNDYFGVSLDDDNYDTIGGLVMYELGHLPRKGETVSAAGLDFRVLQADRRRIQLVEVSRSEAPPGTGAVSLS